VSKPRYDLVDIEGVIDDEFEYAVGVLKEVGDNLGLEAGAVVSMFPAGVIGC